MVARAKVRTIIFLMSFTPSAAAVVLPPLAASASRVCLKAKCSRENTSGGTRPADNLGGDEIDSQISK